MTIINGVKMDDGVDEPNLPREDDARETEMQQFINAADDLARHFYGSKTGNNEAHQAFDVYKTMRARLDA